MHNQRSTEIKVGIVSLLAVILFIVGISLGKGCNVSVNTTVLKFRFPSSGGILPTAPLLVNGVKRGTVLTVQNNNGSVLVTASIDEISDFKKDITAKIMILEITGGKKIEISPGLSNQNFDINAEIPGTTAADLSDIVALVGEMGSDGKILIKKLDTVASAAATLLSDKTFINNIHNTINNASEMTGSMNNLLKNNLSSIQTTLSNLKTLTTDLKVAVQKNSPRIDTLITDIDLTIGDTRALLKNTNSTVNSTDALIADLKKIADEIKNGKGFVHTIISDEDFKLKMDSTLTTLYELIKQLKEHGINTNIRLGTRP
ncbi:MAG: MlaD family protein [Bacteroidota bacterium]